MATQPFDFQSNFELGDSSEWTSTQDVSNQMDFPHYTALLGDHPTLTAAPYSGAYCLRLRLATGNTNNAFVAETAATDFSVDDNVVVRFRVYVGSDLTTSSADDVMSLWVVRGGASNQFQMGIQLNTDGSFQFGAGGVGETVDSNLSTGRYRRNQWYTVEIELHIDNNTATNGTFSLYITSENGRSVSTAVATGTGFDNVAITSTRFGVLLKATETSGTILLDDFKLDSVASAATLPRFGAEPDRYKTPMRLTKTGHAFVGPGKISNATLFGNGGTPPDILRIYDTDEARSLDWDNAILELKNTATNETVDPSDMPIHVQRGCFVQLTTGGSGGDAHGGS